MSNYMNLD